MRGLVRLPMAFGLVLGLVGGCGRLGFDAVDAPLLDGETVDSGIDASVDGGTFDASLDGGGLDAGSDAGSDGGTPILDPFPMPTMIAELAGLGADDPTLTADRLELFFNEGSDIYRASRATTADAWTGIAAVGELNTTSTETSPEVSGDGLTIHFASRRGGDLDVWTATRATRTAMWSAPIQVAELSTAGLFDTNPTVRPDRLEAMLGRGTDASNRDVLRATRALPTDPWGTPVVVAELSGSTNDAGAIVARAGTLVVFFSDRAGTDDLFTATRSSDAAPFGPVVPLGELNTPGDEQDPWISEDGRHLVFVRDGELFETSR